MHSAKIGFGGGCHWCTEAVFDHIIGVTAVKQGWIQSDPPHHTFSEAVLVEYDPQVISLGILVQIHLLTHASTGNHSMRDKYRSAIYFLEPTDEEFLVRTVQHEGEENGLKYVTKILPFVAFKSNSEEFLHYYQTRPNAPFCTTHVLPKFHKLMASYGKHLKRKF